jgi:regulator of replication initiation timing
MVLLMVLRLTNYYKKEVIGCEKCAADKNGNRLDISKEIEKYQTTYPENKYDFSQATWSYRFIYREGFWVKNIICRNLENHDESCIYFIEMGTE